ncbi:MAG: DUF1385 domain-containing protein [Candidatus Adiutricales bacterium]
MTRQKFNVGGQAVLEGVMMRSPSALAVAVRKSNGEVATKEGPWKSIAARVPLLSWPFFRGGIILIEALINGLDALSFSAYQALEDETDEEMSVWAMGLTIAVSFGLGILLFLALPHYLSLLLGRIGPLSFGVRSVAFHAIDGLLKLSFFLGYILLISRIKEIGRVFEYHGAEHKSIFAYEAGKDLTVENAREYTTLHPRCGTAFILIVLILSILIFSAVFPLISSSDQERGWMINILYVFIKILLMMPIAGIAYEFNRFASRHMDRTLLKLAVLPGLWVQKLTTREPTDDQIEIAIIALKKALAIEDAQQA